MIFLLALGYFLVMHSAHRLPAFATPPTAPQTLRLCTFLLITNTFSSPILWGLFCLFHQLAGLSLLSLMSSGKLLLLFFPL